MSGFPSPNPEQTVVGMIGLGNMGFGMATNLVRAGFPIVCQDYDTVRPVRLKQQLLGSGILTEKGHFDCARTAKEVAIKSDIILLSVSDQVAAEEVIFYAEGILDAGIKNRAKVVADLGTVAVGFSKRCHHAFQKFNVGFLDAPVSGGPEGSQHGTLSVMVGGKEEDFAYALPAFKAFGTNVVHMGKGGSGTITKMINQMLVGTHLVAAAEAYILAESLGIGSSGMEKLRSVLGKSWAHSRMLERSFDLYLEAKKAGNDEKLRESAAPIRNLAKDFSIIETAAENNELQLCLMEQVKAMFTAANTSGLDEADLCMIKEMCNLKKKR